jgi:hypothetical protein
VLGAVVGPLAVLRRLACPDTYARVCVIESGKREGGGIFGDVDPHTSRGYLDAYGGALRAIELTKMCHLEDILASTPLYDSCVA